ncbi:MULTISPECIES: hypothetical protein [Cryobacterium]|uniref:Uncharacterized protein n=1 Tax=Cryobacterium breve TaxID=1259258 RepID=A0ABY2J7L6_9MICO|nr:MULTISPECIES: hypothetical protein [Cryobacterium]TFC92036.1 hypothetical protein E3T20_12025 [Cryobacterium sp. TmT3-12]TFC99825.1 hypothetical protein E3O65_05480 [Cryobacterium breve]
MALTDAFPGAPGVADSVDLRKGLAGLIVRDTAGNARPGIFPRHTNALVTARADMMLDIAAFEGAAVRGGGPLFIANAGIDQSPVLANAPAANSRIDVLYFKQNENGYNGFADGTITPIFGIVTGAASGIPAKPSIAGIAGAVELATITVPSTATATNSGGVVITQSYQFTSTSGGLLWFRTSTERDAFAAPIGLHCFVLSDGVEHSRGALAWRNASGGRIGVNRRLTELVLSDAWTDVCTVSAVSSGGPCSADWTMLFINGNSGADRTLNTRIVCDGVLIGVEVPYNAPLTNGTTGLGAAFSAESTPSAGAHVWKLQAAGVGTANAVLSKRAALTVTEH